MNLLRAVRLQILRGIRQPGTLFAIPLMIYSYLFVHTDARYFFEHPLGYFADGGFHYHFIISFWMGLSHYAVPMAGILIFGFILCEDRETGFEASCLYRQSKFRFFLVRILSALAVTAAVVFLVSAAYVLFLLLVTNQKNYGTGQLEAAQASAYGWRASLPFFHVFVLQQIARLALASACWCLVAIGLSAIWANRAFVFVTAFGLSILADSFILEALGEEYTLAFIQTPGIHTKTPIHMFLFRQLIFLAVSAIFSVCALFLKHWRASVLFAQRIRNLAAERFAGRKRLALQLPRKIRGTFLGRMLTSVRMQFSAAALLPAVLIPILVFLTNPLMRSGSKTIGEALLFTFGGIPWFDPRVNFQFIGIWVLILLAPLMGNAINTQRILDDQCFLTLHRHRSKSEWWLLHSLASLVYSIVCAAVMFLSIICFSFCLGSRGLVLFMADADGFIVAQTKQLAQMFVMFTAHIAILGQIQIIFHLLTGRVQAGIIAVLGPVILSLARFSNIWQHRTTAD